MPLDLLCQPVVFDLALTLATFVLVVVLARFNSCYQFLFIFSKVSKVQGLVFGDRFTFYV